MGPNSTKIRKSGAYLKKHLLYLRGNWPILLNLIIVSVEAGIPIVDLGSVIFVALDHRVDLEEGIVYVPEDIGVKFLH